MMRSVPRRCRALVCAIVVVLSGVVEAAERAPVERAAAMMSTGQLDAASSLIAAGLRAADGAQPETGALLLCRANLSILRRQWASAERDLDAVERAGLSDARWRALIAGARGNLCLARGDAPADAVGYFQSAVDAAKVAGDRLLIAQAATNLARAVCATAPPVDGAAARTTLRAAVEAVGALEPGDEQTLLLVGLASIEGPGALDAIERHALLTQAYTAAERVGSDRGRSLAIGHLAELYERSGEPEPAVTCARRAIFFAQRSPDLLYRWQWLLGRVLLAGGDTDGGIAALRQATATLGPIRPSMAIGLGNAMGAPADAGEDESAGAQSRFRRAVGDLYFDLADALLRRAAARAERSAAFVDDLRSARETLEELKTAELENYFQSDCATLVRAGVDEIDAMISPGVAVLYAVPLRDRTELLVSLSGRRMRRVASSTPGSTLLGEVRRLRRDLEDRTSHAYRISGKRVYDTLIAPVEGLLASEQVHTLVFVPDDALRAVPPAALWDGRGFLVERFALATVPGLRLTRGAKGELPWSPPRVLAAGLSQGATVDTGNRTERYAPLEFVDAEMDALARQFSARPVLDGRFTLEALRTGLDSGRFDVVHLSTHGEFSGESTETYLLLSGPTPEARLLTLEELNLLITPAQLRGTPVRLLTLSACRTAEGDPNRAALGLGGVALKAGARSALASLWYVNDRVTARLMSQFYASYASGRGEVGLAEALRRAQLSILRDPEDLRYRHPCYWAPYLLIGQWR